MDCPHNKEVTTCPECWPKEVMTCPECWSEENRRRLEAAMAEMQVLLALPVRERHKALKQIQRAAQ